MLARGSFAVLVVGVIVLSSVLAVGAAAPFVPSEASSGTVTASASTVGAASPASASVGGSPASSASPSSSSPSPSLPASTCSSLETTSNDPSYAAFVAHVDHIAAGATAAGLPAADLGLPYTGAVADQTVDGISQAGAALEQECGLSGEQYTTSQTEPSGVSYDGQIDNATGVQDLTLESNSVAGILTVNSQPENFYPGSGTPTLWGAQENVVLPNVTLFGSTCPTATCSPTGSGNYAFWVQNVISYDSNNDTLYMVDDTWNFTSYSSEMFSSSLVGWSPNGSNYTGVWVAYSPYFHVAPPFTVTAYVNTSVDSAGDQVLWYNYSIYTPTSHIFSGNYDYLIFNSQPTSGAPVAVTPPDFEASAVGYHEVPDNYEFDAFQGADDGSNQLMLAANATMQVQYCVEVPYCTPTNFAYANVPAAVNYGSETGEQGVGIAVNYIGTTAYLSGGPLIIHGLWNYTGQTGVQPGNTPVYNNITVSGSPLALTSEPYVFAFFNNTAYATQGYQWAPDVPVWYLMPGDYTYTVLLADYTEENGTLVVPSSGSATLTVSLPYNPLMGVYTPLWALNNSQLAGISSAGAGTLSDQYVLFNNPTTGYFGFPRDNLSSLFFSSDDYDFPSFTGVLLSHTSAYSELDDLPSFAVTETFGSAPVYYYLGLELFYTSNVTLLNNTALRGWPAWEEISFYITVPAAQNPAPQAAVYIWNSTHDLVMSNTFVAVKAIANFFVSPDALILYGGTDNVVWGNTFEDPPGVAMGSTYAGIALAESGDLIYNNNFSVDNPIVYLPYNWANVADCLPQTLGGCANNQDPGTNGWYYNVAANVVGNTWNVTLQPASDVAETVNGFALSGNVLGPSVATQGGNYYWNYGSTENNRSTSPYVDNFYYSDWSNIFPLGCGTIQAPGAPCGTAPPVVGAYEDGITAGGDYAPYGPTVTIEETGLPAGAAWAVRLGGVLYRSTTPSVALPVAYGKYTWIASTPVSGYVPVVASGSVMASGVPLVLVTFRLSSSATYLVSFAESNLPTGATWSVTFNGATRSSTGISLVFGAYPNGSYSYAIHPVSSWYVLTGASGTVAVHGAAVGVSASYSYTSAVTFSQTGIPLGKKWTAEATLSSPGSLVTPVSAGQSWYANSSGRTATLNLANGTYAWSVTSAAYTSSSGSLTLTGVAVAVPVAPRATYTVTIKEKGLVGGTTWTVTFNGALLTSTTGSLAISGLVNGTYAFTAGSVSGYTVSPTSGNVTVSGSPTSATLTFSKVTPTSIATWIWVVIAVVIVVAVVALVSLFLVRRKPAATPAVAPWTPPAEGSGGSGGSTTASETGGGTPPPSGAAEPPAPPSGGSS